MTAPTPNQLAERLTDIVAPLACLAEYDHTGGNCGGVRVRVDYYLWGGKFGRNTRADAPPVPPDATDAECGGIRVRALQEIPGGSVLESIPPPAAWGHYLLITGAEGPWPFSSADEPLDLQWSDDPDPEWDAYAVGIYEEWGDQDPSEMGDEPQFGSVDGLEALAAVVAIWAKTGTLDLPPVPPGFGGGGPRTT